MSNTKTPRLTNLFGLIAVMYKSHQQRCESTAPAVDTTDLWMSVLYLRAIMHHYWGDVNYGWPKHVAMFQEMWDDYFTSMAHDVKYTPPTVDIDDDAILLKLTAFYSHIYTNNLVGECQDIREFLIKVFESPGRNVCVTYTDPMTDTVTGSETEDDTVTEDRLRRGMTVPIHLWD